MTIDKYYDFGDVGILILPNKEQSLHERFIEATSAHGTCNFKKRWDETRYGKSRKGFLDSVQGLSGKQPRWLTGMNPWEWMSDIFIFCKLGDVCCYPCKWSQPR